MNIEQTIAGELRLQEHQVKVTCELFDEGATVPFLARYRKERTGGLDEEQLRSIQKLREDYTKLEQRRQAVVKSLTEQGVFEGSLKAAVLATRSLTELEDLYLPYKPKRKTRATMAKDLGLEPLARLLLKQPRGSDPLKEAARFLPEDPDKALAGARDIVAEWAAERAEIRKEVRAKARKFGKLKASKRKNAEDPKEVYRAYYDFNSSLGRLAHHQVLALDRGEREKVLSVSLELSERDWRDPLRREFRPYGN